MKQLVLIIIVIFLAGVTPTLAADQLTPSVVINAGATATYGIELSNQTDAEQTYQIHAEGLPAGATAIFRQAGRVTDTASVTPNGNQNLALDVETSVDTPPGRYEFTVSAVRDGDGETVNLPLVLTVDDAFALHITDYTLNTTTTSGGVFSFDVVGTNAGTSPIHNVKLVIDTPNKWVAQAEPLVTDQLAPGETTTYHVNVIVPASQVAINQTLTFSLSGDEVASPDAQMSVRVQNNPNYLIIAGAVMGLAVLGTAVYFRFKGRR